jgi:hypothetical protein
LPEDNKMLPPGYLENLHRTLKGNQKQRLLFGNWEYDDDPDALITYDRILDLFTNTQVKTKTTQKYITADVARMGSDLAVILVWHGWTVIDMVTF